MSNLNQESAVASGYSRIAPPVDRAPQAFLDAAALDAVDGEAFQAAEPFPFAVLDRMLTPAGYDALAANLPDPADFAKTFGRRRAHGQASHDRFVLQYTRWVRIPPVWQRFVAELKSKAYRQFVSRLLGRDDFMLHFHWHYTPNGCSVSPHCDAPWKLGSQIFYLNTDRDWRPEWGGQTLVLDDAGRFQAGSAPSYDDFARTIPSGPIGNTSLIFGRNERSWHAVRPLQCPEDALRKVFIVEFRKKSALMSARTVLGI